MHAKKNNPLARQITAMLIGRVRDARGYWQQAKSSGLPQEIVAEELAQYYALQNAAELARRLLYAEGDGTEPRQS